MALPARFARQTRSSAGVSADDIKRLGSQTALTRAQVKTLFESALKDARDAIVAEMIKNINKWVAKDTGELRASYEKIVESSDLSKRELKLLMKVGTDVQHAQYVDKMPTARLRHAKDPQAITGVQGKLQLQLHAYTIKFVRQFLKQYTAQAGVQYGLFSRKLKVKAH